MNFDLSERQWDRLSEITGNLGIVLLTSTALPFITGQESIKFTFLIPGLILSSGCIIMSIILARRK